MPKLKHLKSIAHNLAHSYFSLMHYVDGDYILEHLFKIVKENHISEFRVDVLNERIKPEIFMTQTIKQSLKGLKAHAGRLFEPHEITWSDIKSFDFFIVYDFEKTEDDIHHVYSLESIIIDKNDKEHRANVVEWWKY